MIFDLSKTLMLASRSSKFTTFDRDSILEKKPHNDVIGDQKIFFRPGRNELLDYLFQKAHCLIILKKKFNRKKIYKVPDFFEIGVWSSLDKDNTNLFAKSFFERYYRK